MPITLEPIGVVRSPYETVLDAPRQGEFAAVESVIEMDPRFVEGLAGLAPGDRLLVVWWAHAANRSMLRQPGTDGVFTMRTPHRPNPIALSEVTVVRREGEGGSRVVVRELEAIDGTPVLDLKSARAEYDGWIPLPGVNLDAD